jgi:hypothetical protein
LAFAALPAGSAVADTTIGHVGGELGIGAPALIGDVNYVVPAGGGTITSFSFQSTSANTGQQLDFLVLRHTASPFGPFFYTVVGKTGLITLAGAGAEPETFPASPAIAVQEGDILGFWEGGLANCCRLVTSGGGLLFGLVFADPSVGDTFSLGPSIAPVDLNESANLVPTASALAAKLVSDADHLKPGTALADKATAMQTAVNAGQTATACADITNLLGLVTAQTGKKLSPANADLLTADANNLAVALGC